MIPTQFLSLAKLLEGRIFNIPEYQRAYSWTSRQRRDLFSDIENTFKKGPCETHFMSTIVCLRQKKPISGTNQSCVELVDGQQRLTTLVILLNALRLKLDDKCKAQQDLTHLLMNNGALVVIQTNHDTCHYFTNYLRYGKLEGLDSARTLADRELLKAIIECEHFVSEWIDTGSLQDLIGLIESRLQFLVHEINEEKDAYSIFEVLNSRGIKVTELDRLRCILMAAAFELKSPNRKEIIKELHLTWAKIYSVIGLRSQIGSEALRFAATLKLHDPPSKLLSEEVAVGKFKRKFDNASQILSSAHWLLQVVTACSKVTEDHRIDAVTQISQVRFLAVAVHLNEVLQKDQKETLLARLEKVAFRTYGMLRLDARKGVGEYVRLACKVAAGDLSYRGIQSEIKELGKEFPIELAVDFLRSQNNCYTKWEKELRYFMFRYEEHLAKKQGQVSRNKKWVEIWMAEPSESIEHIWAKSKAPDTQRHRLGNLVLLPPRLNSSLKAKTPILKSTLYTKTGLLIAGKVADQINKSGWNAKSIEAREKELLEWAIVEWAD